MDKELYEEHYQAVFKYILYLTNSSELAHDLLQETFYRFFKQNTLAIEQKRAFLLRIARNIVFDHYRKKRLIQFFSLAKDNRVDVEPLPEEVLIKGEEVAALYRALQEIKLTYREVVILRYIEDYSVKEVASILGCSQVQVKNNTARGLQALRKLLGGGEVYE